MKLEGRLDVPVDARRHPARHEVVDGVLIRDGGERIPVVVKKTKRGRLESGRATRASRSLATARALLACGVATPEPLGIVETDDESWYVARRLEAAEQIRRWFLHRDAPALHPVPALPFRFEEVVAALGRLARSMHDGGVHFRDFTDGNVLVTGASGCPELWLVDLDRARCSSRPVGTWRRLRDLARPGLNRSEDQKIFLQSYFAPEPPPVWQVRATWLLRRRIVAWDDLKRWIRPWRNREAR